CGREWLLERAMDYW
nr:immunoglobulin heavy chain junction region [Mus musculus]